MNFHERDLIDFKMSMAKDLEKRIKMGYKNQFRNIVISITSIPKRYKKIKSAANVSEDIQKLEDINKSIFNYLQDMFDVFGDNAILNAKRIFEDNSNKWGKKFYKNFNQNYNAIDIKKLIKELYPGLKDIDYITSANRQITWSFIKPAEKAESLSHTARYFNTLYELKSIWLQHFLKGIAPGYISVLEIAEQSEDYIITNITMKQSATEAT